MNKTGLNCVGRVDRLPPIYQNPNKDQYDKTFTEFCHSIGHTDLYPEFGICRPTKNREEVAISRYGLKYPETPPSQYFTDKLLDWLEFEFGPYVEGYRVIDFEDVEIQRATTPGIPYKWYTKTKQEATKVFKRDIIAFWEQGHKIGADLFWHNFVKTELLPTHKLEKDNVRSITGPDIAFHYSYCRMVQDFNHRMYDSIEHLNTCSALGFNKFEGGINRLAKKMNKHPHKEEADMSKYDARQPRWLRMMCMAFRWRMLRPEDKTDENFRRLTYYYMQSIESKVVLGSGYVMEINHGMKSGDPNTSVDNTLIHFIVLAYSYMNLVSEDYTHFKEHLEAMLYGDDELLSMSDLIEDQFSADKRSPFYEKCGVHLTVESVNRSDSLSGMTFLGNRFMWLNRFGVYVGVPVNPRKTLASVLKPPNKLDAGQSLTRAVALLMECYWEHDSRELLHQYVRWLVRKGVKMDLSVGFTSDGDYYDLSRFGGQVPTLRRIEQLWLGHQ